MGYKAVYPDEAIQAHLAHLTRRRALRPSEEYRAPTDAEWQQFLGHFERRKLAAGTCGRVFATPCPHEHACIRCPMLWPDPAQKQRLTEIRDNLTARIAEAGREGWPGEIEGLKISLAGAEDKLAQISRRTEPRNRPRNPGNPRTLNQPKQTRQTNRQVQRIIHQQRGVIPARVPGAKHLEDERAGGTRPLRPPGKRHALPNRQPSHHRTRPSPAAPPRETGRAAGGRRDMHAQLNPERQAGTTGLRGPLSVARPCLRPPSVAVRAKPTVPHTAPRPRFPSAIRPWTPQHDGLQRDKVTHAGTEKKRPASARIRS